MKHLLRLMCLATLVFGSPLVGAQTRSYCCVDSAGHKSCGDPLPQVCYDRAYREMSPSGRVVREIEAPLTPEQRARRDAELKAQRDRAIATAEAQRRDRVLMDTYNSVSEIEARRNRDIAPLEVELKIAKSREADLLATRAKLEKQVPANGAVPPDMADRLATNTSELAAVRSVIDSKQRTLDATQARFEQDRTRYLELSEAAARKRP
jgi:hypothetical protein